MRIRALTFAALSLVALIAFGASAWVIATGGGGDLSIGWTRVSLRNAARPFLIAGAAATLLVLVAPGWRSRVDRLANRAAALSSSVFLAATLVLAAGVLLVGLRYGSFVPSAADSYGYVTQAELWLHGVPRVEQTLPASFPWPDAQHTFAPLGYRPSLDGRAIVPVYPPGYPLLMAATIFLFGQGSQYAVVPVLSALTVLGVFLLGRGVAGPWIGIIAALWLCASPAFLFHTCIPMSDVPATAAWTWALFLMLRPTTGSAIAAGLLSGAAILIRPNLAPLAALIAVMNPRVAIAFVSATLPGVIALAWLNDGWYGSPFATGYDLRAPFALGYLPTNLWHYVSWLWETQTVAIFLAPLALWTNGTSDERSRRLRWRLLLFACGVVACYAFYLPFDTWHYLRFLLPAYPALLLLSAAALVDLVSRFPRPVAVLVATTLVGTITLANLREAQARGAFDNWVSVRRFVEVPELARTRLPPNAIYLTRLYSGCLRYYANRPTVRWDLLDLAWLDRAIGHLQARGFVPLIVIEMGDEDREYRERFRGTRFGALDWPPIAEYHRVQTVRIYDPAQRR